MAKTEQTLRFSGAEIEAVIRARAAVLADAAAQLADTGLQAACVNLGRKLQLVDADETEGSKREQHAGL